MKHFRDSVSIKQPPQMPMHLQLLMTTNSIGQRPRAAAVRNASQTAQV